MNRRLAVVIGLAAVVLAAGIGFEVVRSVMDPVVRFPDPQSPPPIQFVEIPEGATLRQVAVSLEREGLIRNRWGFVLLGKVVWAERRVQAGEYAFHAAMPPGDILADVLNGRVYLHAVTVPEGYSLEQIAETLSAEGIVEKTEFMQLTHDREFLRTLQVDAPSLEGYLYPDTYRFPRRTKPKEVIQAMVSTLWQQFTPELRARAESMSWSLHAVLTMASVIEKETGVAAERALISAVFHNRLKRKMALQSDPTVIYAIPNFDGNLRKHDLMFNSPYNTYRYRGLPPGPIASPGLGSIKAALYPAAVSYLYFVSRNDGTHQFSSTLAEHSRAVEKYQRHGRRQRLVSVTS